MADDDVDALYGLPLEEFVPARDALAREARREKRRDDAAAIAALAKPTRPAWMMNQLAREEGALVAKLVECAEALAEAQNDALEGKGARDLRAAGRAERQAVDRLVAAARDLRPEGHKPSAAMLERVRTALQAVAGDDALRERIRAGRLVEEPAAGGAWPSIGLPEESGDEAPVPAPSRTGRSSRRRSPDDRKGPAVAKTAEGTDGAASSSRTGPDTRSRPGRASKTKVADRRAKNAVDAQAGEPAEAVDEAKAAREREQAAKEQEAEARRRREVRDALATARKRAREADRDRERARRDAERARERFERLVADAESARAAAESAAATLEQLESTANDADDEGARLEAELTRD